MKLKNNRAMLLTIRAEGPAFYDENGDFLPEPVIAEIFEDLAAQLRSGATVADMHGDKVKAWNGQRVGGILAASFKRESK